MEARFARHGITTTEQMFQAPTQLLHQVWGSVLGDRWWYLIRGYEVPTAATKKSSVSHSNVLPPEFRTPAGARAVLIRLVQKASARMRDDGYRAQQMQIFIEALSRSWSINSRFDAVADPLTLMDKFQRLWNERRFTGRPVRVGVNLYDLVPEKNVTPSLFGQPNHRHDLGKALDRINKRFGKNSIYLAAAHSAKDTAEEKIAFTKTTMFDEGPVRQAVGSE